MLWLLACTPDPLPLPADPPEDPPDSAPPEPPGNVLVLLSDDQGTDKVGAYREHPLTPPTPNIDALAARGQLFRRAYASPVCSPSRASLLTGRMPRRTGIGEVIQIWADLQLPLSEVLLPELLEGADPEWSSAAIGKWHIAELRSPSGRDHPTDQGFDRFLGTMGNLYDTWIPGQPLPGYYDWEKVTDGRTSQEQRYATTVVVDDALEAIQTLPEPWLVYVGFHAPHAPLDPPPAELCPISGAVLSDAPPVVRYHAMVEAMDTEIGRLLGAVDPEVLARTTVFFLSDNGTPEHAVLPPLEPTRAKVTPYEGGVRIPLIVAGPLVDQPGTESLALVHVTDLFPTVAEIAGVTPDGQIPIDGHSLLPLLRDPEADWPRTVVHTERFFPNGLPPAEGREVDVRTSRDDDFKVIEIASDGLLGLFDVRDGLDDGPPLTPEDFAEEDRPRVEALLLEHQAYWDSLVSGP